MDKTDANTLTEWRIVNSWWVLLPLVYLGWAAFIYIGMKTKTLRWKIYGAVYFVIFTLSLTHGMALLVGEHHNDRNDVLLLAFYLVISTIHAVMSRTEYLMRQEVIDRNDLDAREKKNLKLSIYAKYAEKYDRSAAQNFNRALNEQNRSERKNEVHTESTGISQRGSTAGGQAAAGEREDSGKRTEEATGRSGQIDISTCTEADLASLPGINMIFAKKAVQYREEHGGFQSVEELFDVIGLKERFRVRNAEILYCSAPAVRSVRGKRKLDL